MNQSVERQEQQAAEFDELSDEALDRVPDSPPPFCTYFTSGGGGWVRPRAPKDKS